MTFLLAEDKALRLKLQGITVTDQQADASEVTRQVGVRFGQPDQELAKQAFPFIIIEMIDVEKDDAREMRGIASPWYMAPDDLGPTESFVVHTPIPVNIDYQITAYSRHPRHDRQIMAQLLGTVLPIRFGVLEVATDVVDGDGDPTTTVRRLDVLNVSKRDIPEQSKRLFMIAITVRVSSELPVDVIKVLQQVTSAHIDELSSENSGGTPHSPQFISADPIIID
jgi:hypothetical protein